MSPHTKRLVLLSGDNPDDAHKIVSITDNGVSGPRVLTKAPHGLPGTPVIVITGTGTYDGTYTGALGDYTVIDAAHFDLNTVFYSGDTFGGRWDYV